MGQLLITSQVDTHGIPQLPLTYIGMTYQVPSVGGHQIVKEIGWTK